MKKGRTRWGDVRIDAKRRSMGGELRNRRSGRRRVWKTCEDGGELSSWIKREKSTEGGRDLLCHDRRLDEDADPRDQDGTIDS